MPPLNRDTGYRLVRNVMGINMAEMAAECRLSRVYWNELEQGAKTNPSRKTVESIAAATGLTTETIRYLSTLGPDEIAEIRKMLVLSLENLAT